MPTDDDGLLGPGSETLDEYRRRRLGGAEPIHLASLGETDAVTEALSAYDSGDVFERAFTERYGVL